MTFDRAKILAEGGTFYGADNMLVESTELVVTSHKMVAVAETGTCPAYIKEDANLPKRMVIEGVFQRAGVRNANQRLYPLSLWERLLSKDGAVMTRIRERAMIGHLEHPTEGTTDLNKGAILITEVWMKDDGTVMGRALVYNTPEGQRIQEYVVTGTKIGISSRGTGTVDAKGTVCEDFQLETWDMVYNPSTPGAHPTLKNESAEPPVHVKPVVESTIATPIIPPQDKPMNLFERISAVTTEVQRLLATDSKRLTTEGARKFYGELIESRVKIAEEFTGEKRVAQITGLLASLDKAIKETEGVAGFTASTVGAAAPEGQVATGVPGTWDALDKALASAGEGKAKALEHVSSVATLIAANLGKLPQIVPAIESAIKGDAATPSKEQTETQALLADAKEELDKMVEQVDAATAIATELQTRLAALETKRAEESANAAKIIADLTSKIAAQGGEKKPETNEAKKPEGTPEKQKTLAERIADQAKSQNANESALPPNGTTTESKKDAGEVDPKKVPSEDANKEVTEAKTKVTTKVVQGAAKRMSESLGSFK